MKKFHPATLSHASANRIPVQLAQCQNWDSKCLSGSFPAGLVFPYLFCFGLRLLESCFQLLIRVRRGSRRFLRLGRSFLTRPGIRYRLLQHFSGFIICHKHLHPVFGHKKGAQLFSQAPWGVPPFSTKIQKYRP